MELDLNINEVAARKGVRRQTVHAAIRAGRLPARVEVPPGGAAGVWRVRVEDANAWEPIKDPTARGKLGGQPRQRGRNTESEGHEEAK